MLLPLVYYLAAIFTYILLYGYYKNNTKKQVARLDFLQSLETTPTTTAQLVNKKPFEQIKKAITSNFQFDRIRIVFGIDFSASNEWQGRKTFQGQPLHKTQGSKIFNPYQKAISQFGATFEDVLGSKHIEYSCFGFGDEQSKDYTFFPIVATGEEFSSYQLVLDAYYQQTQNIVLGGPTSFTPVIKKLISFGIHYPKDFALLVIITDELKVSSDDNAFVESIRLLTSIPNVALILIGVGDGPWQRMSYEEHRLREAVFAKGKPKKVQKLQEAIGQSKYVYDNFHFVDFNTYTPPPTKQDKNVDTENYFGRALLTKLPSQFKQVRRLNKKAEAEAKAKAEAEPKVEAKAKAKAEPKVEAKVKAEVAKVEVEAEAEIYVEA